MGVGVQVGGGGWVLEKWRWLGLLPWVWPSRAHCAESDHSFSSQGSDSTGMHQDHRREEPRTLISSKFYEA